MKIFRQVQKYLAIYGIGLYQQPFNSRNLLAILIFGMTTASCCVHIFCEVETFQEYAESIFTTLSVIIATTNFIYIVSEMCRLYDCFKEPEKIMNHRINSCPSSENTYKQTDRHTESMTKIVVSSMIHFFIPASMIFVLIVTFYMYYFTDVGVDAFRLPVPYWFPFDWKNPRGYLVASAVSYVFDINVALFLVCDFCIGVGFYIFSTALIEDIKNDFIEFDVWLKSEPNPILLSKRLYDLIHFHSMMKRCVCNLADIVQPILMLVFGANFVTICVAMLSIQILVSQNNLVSLAISIFQLLGTFIFLFAPCELAGRLSSKFDDINNLINQFDWYLFPYGIKRMLPLIMANSQQEVGFTCLGSFLCNRATFKKVMNCTFSYFMTLRAFE